MKEFNPDLPVVVGLAGPAGSGKTATASVLAPQAQITDLKAQRVKWSHLFYAMPLYELAAIRRTVKGNASKDRQLYQIHATLVDVFGTSPLFGAPPYHKLVEMVEEISQFPFPVDGAKPREFMQYVGTDIMRAWDQDVWVKWMKRKIVSEFARFNNDKAIPDYQDEDGPPEKEELFGIIVSDVRFENEAKLICDHPNGILIKLEADAATRAERQEKRDGFLMSEKMNSHSSETSVESIPQEWYHAIVNTTETTIQEQVGNVVDLVEEFTGIQLYTERAASR